MNKSEKIALAVVATAVAAIVLFNLRNNASAFPNAAGIEPGLSQNPDTANMIGPTYLVANMPYGYGPPVTMQAPVTSQGLQGQTSPVYDTSDCGCK